MSAVFHDAQVVPRYVNYTVAIPWEQSNSRVRVVWLSVLPRTEELTSLRLLLLPHNCCGTSSIPHDSEHTVCLVLHRMVRG